MSIDSRRLRVLNDSPLGTGEVIYWMSRDQRLQDNWAYFFASGLARSRKVPLTVIFCLVTPYLNAPHRAYDYIFANIKSVADTARKHKVGFEVMQSKDPAQSINVYAKKHKPKAIVCDYSPLRLGRKWRDTVAKSAGCTVYEVDAHNIVPVWVTSAKKEFSARTIRPKIHTHLQDFLTPFPHLSDHPFHHLPDRLAEMQKSVEHILTNHKKSTIQSPEDILNTFIHSKIQKYDDLRNDPSQNFQSGLSAYLHYGSLSAQTVALQVSESKDSKNKDAFLEELIVRRELAENFCHFEKNYDTFEGIPEWGKKTLLKHKNDTRAYNYSFEEFKEAKTHDPLWNAAQKEMVQTGKMHGYMRMYWAKKILEWSASPESAVDIAVRLNDSFELDGRDPNGYAGILWSIGGLHDRPWFERPIFGMVRYMSFEGMKRKFNVQKYIQHVEAL